MKDTKESFEKLLTIMDELRSKCPWDKEQTFESLRHLTIEETYELSQAIIEKDDNAVKQELGDLMLHLVFYSKIASEENRFSMKDVIEGICEKLILRHPHIYGNVQADDAITVKQNWEKIKYSQRKSSILGGVPVQLPSLLKAYRMQEKASGVGFDWEKSEQVKLKVIEELNEFLAEIDSGDSKEELENELGDLLFALVNYARFLKINPEDALEKTNKKFISRFGFIESELIRQNKDITKTSLEEMEEIWQRAKTELPT